MTSDLLTKVSASRLNCFHQCRLKFFFRYVRKLKKDKTPALHVGTTVHAVHPGTGGDAGSVEAAEACSGLGGGAGLVGAAGLDLGLGGGVLRGGRPPGACMSENPSSGCPLEEPGAGPDPDAPPVPRVPGAARA